METVDQLPFEKSEHQQAEQDAAPAPPVPEAASPRKSPGELIKAEPSGVIRGHTFEDQWRLARAYFESRLMPKGLDSPEKVLVAMQLCHELGLPPMTSIGKICVINGTPSVFGDLPLGLVMRSGLLMDIEEKIEYVGEPGKPEEIHVAVCTVTRKGGVKITRQFSVADARKAGLWDKSIWKSYPKRMLQMRARSWALKDCFPDVLMGISIGEYDLNTVEEEAQKAQSIAKEIDREYLGEGA